MCTIVHSHHLSWKPLLHNQASPGVWEWCVLVFFMVQEQLLHQDVPLYEVRVVCWWGGCFPEASNVSLSPIILFPSSYTAVKEDAQDKWLCSSYWKETLGITMGHPAPTCTTPLTHCTRSSVCKPQIHFFSPTKWYWYTQELMNCHVSSWYTTIWHTDTKVPYIYSLYTASYTASSHRATACAPGSGRVSWLTWTLLALPACATISAVAAVPTLAACMRQEIAQSCLLSPSVLKRCTSTAAFNVSTAFSRVVDSGRSRMRTLTAGSRASSWNTNSKD